MTVTTATSAEHRPGVRCVLHTTDFRMRSDQNITVLTKPASPGILQNLVATVCAH